MTSLLMNYVMSGLSALLLFAYMDSSDFFLMIRINDAKDLFAKD